MRYNVADLLKSPPGRTRTVDVDEPLRLEDSDVELTSPMQGRLTFTRDHAGILVQGRLRTTARLMCVRCLETVDERVDIELSDEFLPTVHIPGGPDLVGGPDREAATEIDEHHVLDVTEVVRQGVLIAMPLHVLCAADCRGLCPQCGANRNEVDCGCAPPEDPRWGPLRELLAGD